MSESTVSRDGGCRCGRVRFRLSALPFLTMACHCKGCQRMTGGPYSLSVAVPSEGFSVTTGAPVIGGLHGAIRHYFCSYCMSWLFTRPDGLDWFVNVRATMLDEVDWFVPFIETCTDEKLPWVVTPAVRSFAVFPTIEEYGDLTRQYAEYAAKPEM